MHRTKVIFYLFSFIFLSIGSLHAQKKKKTEARLKVNWNRDWKFFLGDDTMASATDYDDAQWELVGLPHSFSIPYFMSTDFYVGYGWYRKTLDLKEKKPAQNYFIEFEGAFQEAEVYVNGTKVGEHRGGYTGFQVPVTAQLKTGRNIIAVRVNNLWKADLAPRAGEHVFSGGLYRDVYLVQTSDVHVAWYGTFVKTPEVSKDRASVDLSVHVINESAQGKDIRIETQLIDPQGTLVGTQVSRLKMQAKKTDTLHQQFSDVENPKLWHPDHPDLYQARTRIYAGNKLLDEYHTEFGIRSIRWTKDEGFFLNGEHLYLRGANVHQDHAGWGDAVTNAGFEQCALDERSRF